MNSKKGALIGIVGLVGVVLGTRAASAGAWGSFTSEPDTGGCDSPSGLVSNSGDSDKTTYGLWIPDNGFTDQIRGQAIKASDGTIYCTSNFLDDGTSWIVHCGTSSMTQYRCQTRRM